MIGLREIADNETTISSTRWGWALTLKVDVIIICTVIFAGLVGHFTKRPIPNEFYSSVTLLLGVLTAITGSTKALQGFEPRKEQKE